MAQSSIALRIGSRGSPLALAQAHELRDRIAAASGIATDAIEIAVIRTTGDIVQDRTLAEMTDAEKNAVSHRAKAVHALRLPLEKGLFARSERARRSPV